MQKMNLCHALILLGGVVGVARAQFGSLNWGSPSNIGPPSRPHHQNAPPPPGGAPPPYGKPPPRPYARPPPGGGGPPPGGEGGPPRGDPYSDHVDPIPPMADGDGSYDTQQLPAKLPILAPNGVVEIYNRVVDDLIRKLEGDLVRKELDPMSVVIRPTPPGPVRVPGYLQKRPFRRPGAALYRSTSPVGQGPTSLKKRKTARAGVLPPETRFGDTARPDASGDAGFRGAGKISKGPIVVDSSADDDEKELLETTSASTPSTTTTTSSSSVSSTAASESDAGSDALPSISISSEERGSSEEDTFMKPRSDEFFPEPEEEEEDDTAPKKKEKKESPSEEVEEEAVSEDKGNPDVDSLIQHYQSKNSKTKDKYAGKKKGAAKPVVVDPSSADDEPTSAEKSDDKKSGKERKSTKGKKKASKKPPTEKDSEEDDDDEDDEPELRDDSHHDDEEFDGPPEAGTGGGKRPNGGFYPPGGPPAIPAKPNAELSGLGRIRRASDVSVSVDARSAVITARLLVGPIHVVINDSIEPMEKNVKATIPELEAELLLMERHGVVFLQRFTLDRAYGQDVEISIPKSKDSKNKKNKNQSAQSAANNDPNHPMNVEARRQTKMAAHISMEVVKLLRSGNLRVNLMRTAQGAMSKLKLPIKKAKGGKGGNSSGGSKKSKASNKKDKVKKTSSSNTSQE